MSEQKTLKQEAQEYESPTKTRNIIEIDQVSVNAVIEDDNFTNKDGEEVKQKVIVVDGEKYRVPVSVINNLKVILEDNKNLKEFKVRKVGEGMDTRYTVIPL
ncbi:MAG: hypothetical protein KAQ92_00160 [Candidatus Aenigmarchaeota archaeon]|nr:hypothetical protein [Candidatus Aenigmarchaeota archaeon]